MVETTPSMDSLPRGVSAMTTSATLCWDFWKVVPPFFLLTTFE